MPVITRNSVFSDILGIGIIVGGIALQLYLSGKRSRWPGLMLPFITFLCSAVRLCFTRFFRMTVYEIIWNYLLHFFWANIPTLILLVIYLLCRGRKKKKKDRMLDKMNIQDLN